MKRLSYFFPILIVTLMLQNICLSADNVVWVSSTNASLKADQSASSQTIADLSVGDELAVISIDKKWYKVKTKSGKEGFIYRGKISDTKPETMASQGKSGGGAGGLLGDLTGSGITANSADSSRSIRGLSPEAQEYAQQTGKPQEFRDALDSVLELKTDDKEIEQFLVDGKIGEYAE
ncbi:MAG: SH3 domain-containing protein [Proteobacteria bacterium]|nr:SH3 domain-containing protein [Pseudomonadota bacterium]